MPSITTAAALVLLTSSSWNCGGEEGGGATVVSVQAFVLPPVSWRPTRSSTADAQSVILHGSKRADIDITFGSDEESQSGAKWGDDETDGDDIRQHQARVAQLLQEADADFRQARKNLKWGKFANVTRAADLEPLLQQERAAIKAENDRKAALAALQGIHMQVLEPKDSLYGGGGNSFFEDNGNVQISAGSKGWFTEMDEDIQAEWRELTLSSSSSSDKDGDDSENDDDDDDGQSTGLDAALDVTMDDSTGKIVARDALAGVRVGSAGGWTVRACFETFSCCNFICASLSLRLYL